MLDTAHVVTWRWSDGSGSGATAAFMDKARADRLLEILAADQCSRVYKIEAVPFDSAAGATAGAPGSTDAERAAWLADKIVALGDYAKEAAAMLRRWPDGVIGTSGGQRDD